MGISRKVILVLAAVGMLIIFFIQKDYSQQISPLTGDEPHYVMMTESLVKDGDFNLKNDYELGRSRNYFGANIFPHLSPAIDQDSSGWYSIHTIGLPLIMAIPYELFGMHGARAVLMSIQFSSVLIFYMIMKRFLKHRRQRLLGAILLLSCALLWQNLGAVYPDLVNVSLWGLIILLFGKHDRLSNSIMPLVLILGFLVHSKSIVLTGPLVLFNALWLMREYGFGKWFRRYYWTVVLLLVGFIAYVYFLYANYGIFSPTQLYDQTGPDKQFFATNPLTNIIAMLTDRSKGVLIYSPVLILAGPYIVQAFRDITSFIKKVRQQKIKLTSTQYLIAGLFLGLSALFILQVWFLDWSGSISPNGRYLLPFIFVIIFLTAKYADLSNHAQSFFLGLIILLSVYLSWLSIFDLKGFMSAYINSSWSARFPVLMHFPLFDVASYSHDRLATPRGALICLILLIFNIGLVILYRYRVKLSFKKIENKKI